MAWHRVANSRSLGCCFRFQISLRCGGCWQASVGFLTSATAGGTAALRIITLCPLCRIAAVSHAENLSFPNQQFADHFTSRLCFDQKTPRILVAVLHVGLTRGWVKWEGCPNGLFRWDDTVICRYVALQIALTLLECKGWSVGKSFLKREKCGLLGFQPMMHSLGWRRVGIDVCI